MDWDLVREQDGVAAGRLTFHGVDAAGYNQLMTALRPGSVRKEYPIGESPQLANIFVRKFISAKGEFPAQGFRTPGWVHSAITGWWTRMVDFVLNELSDPVRHSGLGIPILATRYGIVQNNFAFFAMLELYNPDTCTFFTPVGELGFALHEMHEVTGLSIGELPYEEFIPGTEELAILKKAGPGIYDTYWELMCHFHVCTQLTGSRGGGVKQGSWADYLFKNLHEKDGEVVRLSPSTPEEVSARIVKATDRYVNEAMEDKFPAFTEFDSFHYQAQAPISDMALFAGFLMLWLKRCVVPTKPVEALAAEVVYPAVLLAYGRPLDLLSASASCLQSGLRELASEFVQVKETITDGVAALETPSPRVPLPYTYLAAWFVMHCPALMTTPAPGEASVPFVHRLDTAHWAGGYPVFFRQTLSKAINYTVFRCFPSFEGGAYGTIHQDLKGSNSFTTLNGGVFRWLMNIRPGYLVFRQGRKCFIEPYQPYRFARQFGYDQIYIGNPNPRLAVVGNLYEGARAWYYSVAGCTGVKFRLPHKVPNIYTSLGFCTWFYAASQVPEYKIYVSCLKGIRKMYDQKRSARKTSRLRGFEEFLSFEEEAKKDGADTAGTTRPEPTKGTAKAATVTGKRALTAGETAQYEKRARRKLDVDLSTSQSDRGAKLMGDAFRSAPAVMAASDTLLEEEAQESSVAGISHQAGLRTVGPALVGGASSYHSPEGGDESEMGDAESVLAKDAIDQPSAADPINVEAGGVGGSLSPSTFVPISEVPGASPTTGLLSKTLGIDISESSSGEKVNYEGSSDDDIDWPDEPVPSPGKTSAYTPISSPGSLIREEALAPDQPATDVSSPERQAGAAPLAGTPPPTRSGPLVISLLPTREISVLGSLQTKAFSALVSSPSTLEVPVPSATSSPATSTAVTPVLATTAAAASASTALVVASSSSSPMTSLSPVVAPSFLGVFIEELERGMRMTVEAVCAGRSSFESLKPILMNYLNNVTCVGDAQCTQRCSEAISRLEEDLKLLQGLTNVDLDAQVEATFADVRAQVAHHHEALQKALNDKESEFESLKTRCDQLQDELTPQTAAVKAIKESIATIEATIAELQATLVKKKERLPREEAAEAELIRKSEEAHNAYHEEAQALEKLRKEVAAAAPNEEELKMKALALVHSAHEKEVAEVKSRLASFSLRGSSA